MAKKKVLPVSPAEAQAQKKDIPSEVIEAWNKVIIKNLEQGTAVIKQQEIVKAIVSAMGCSSDKVFDNHWLDVEPIYRKRGWDVEYDKPAYNETYEAFFTFKMKKKKKG